MHFVCVRSLREEGGEEEKRRGGEGGVGGIGILHRGRAEQDGSAPTKA